MLPEQIENIQENVPGKYRVGQDCIGCSFCSEIAPDNFKTDYEGNPEVVYSYVCKQPENDKEAEQCEEAMLNCPASAIKDDGNP